MIPPIKWFQASVLAITAFNLILVFVRILFARKRNPLAGKMLLVWFFGEGIAMFMMFIIGTGIIVHIPWLYRLPSPGYFLIFPSAYLYMRMILTKNGGLTRWDALHILPAVLHFFEYLPFYLKPYSYKLEVVRAVVSNPLGAFTHTEGILLEYQHIMLMGILGMGYAIAMFRLLSHSKKAGEFVTDYSSKMRRLLWFFVLLQFIFALSPIVFLGIPQIVPMNSSGIMLFLVLALTQLGAAIIFILYPNLQNGIRELPENSMVSTNGFLNKASVVSAQIPSQVIEKDHSTPSKIVPKVTAQQQLFINRLEEHLAIHKSFLNKNFSVVDLAHELNVPTDYLSNFLNQVMGQRFSDYINLKRIAYMEGRILNEALKKYTLESIAMESGFNTRLTFIRAIIKLKGCSPKVYFKGVIKQDLMTKGGN